MGTGMRQARPVMFPNGRGNNPFDFLSTIRIFGLGDEDERNKEGKE